MSDRPLALMSSRPSYCPECGGQLSQEPGEWLAGVSYACPNCDLAYQYASRDAIKGFADQCGDLAQYADRDFGRRSRR